MKILCPGFILLIGFYSNILHAQTPGWVWLKGAKGNGAQEGVAIATDKYNNVYMTGDYQDGADTVLFDSVLITTTVPYNNSLYILVKYSPTGKALWARTSYVVSDWGTSGGLSICTDQSANVLVTGVFDDSMKFDNTHILTGGGIFTVCYDSLGNVLWASKGESTEGPIANSISADNNGNSYITGYFNDDSIEFGQHTLYAANSNSNTSATLSPVNYFIVKYSNTGSVLWANSLYSPCDTEFVSGASVATDKLGNVYVTGGYIADSIIIGGHVLYGPNLNDYEFIAKYDSLGTLLWVKGFSGVGSIGIIVDGDFNIYTVGGYASISSFSHLPEVALIGSDTLYNANPGTSIESFFIAKYDNSGNALWVKTASNPGVGSGAWSIALNSDNDVFASGSFNDSITFGSSTLVQPLDSTDPLFIVAYDPNGNVICSTSLPSGGDDNNGIAVDRLGYVYVGGDIAYNVIIPKVDSIIPVNEGSGEVFFVAKYNCNIKLTGLNNIDPISPITVYPNPSTGSFYFSGVMDGSMIEVYDMMGQKINTTSLRPSPERETVTAINLFGRAAGVYFYRVSDQNNTIQTGKLVVE